MFGPEGCRTRLFGYIGDMDELTCTDCSCATGEDGARDVKLRRIGGVTEARCEECALFAGDEAEADAEDERAFYA